ncbi:hypothetical protein CRS_22670 [Chryseobacterium sp. ON_d1]|nr:hypothetical protein CRS_22670 [Chryseobacterium sp. ON_d1]
MYPVYLCGIRWSYIYFISAIYKNIGAVWSAVDVDGFKRVQGSSLNYGKPYLKLQYFFYFYRIHKSKHSFY